MLFLIFLRFLDQNFPISQKKESTQTKLSILEIGFGTGLNAFITFLEADKKNIKINYVGVEAYPIAADEVEKLNYVAELKAENNQLVFNEMHTMSWDEKQTISDNFLLTKRKQVFADINDENTFDLIYLMLLELQINLNCGQKKFFKKCLQR